MIPERTGITVDSTVQGENVAMSIDQSALAHIINVLTDLYSDPELAVLREYSTNALDSHIEAGQSRPIEVNTPTDLRPLLTIRDYGVGLDAEDIRAVYSQYGKSTKRSSNDAVGMLGLGCKSALAYVDQFTLAGIKDGERMLVSIARDETGAGTMTVLEAGTTDEPDGVEIAIPSDDQFTLEQKARDFFAYWEPGLVTLNGGEPSQLEGYVVGDYTVAERARNAWSTPGRHDANPLTVVMGNVSYPPPDGYTHEAIDSLPADKRLVVRVPIGAVHFTPSREGLQDSDRTRAAIAAALEDFQSQVAEAVTEAITQAPDRPAAARALIEARAAFGRKNVPELQWNGEDIPVVLTAEDLAPIPAVETDSGTTLKPGHAASLWAAKMVSGYSGGESHRYPAGQVSLDDAGRNPWVLGYDNTKWSATQRRKLNRYLEHHELHDEPNRATIFITDAAAVPRPEWIDGAVTAVTWKDVREWKDPLKVTEGGTGGVKYAGTYCVWHGGYRQEKFEADSLPTEGRKLYYVIGDKYAGEIVRQCVNLLADDVYVVHVSHARSKKFLRLFPHARDAVAAAKRGAQGWYDSLGAESREAIALSSQLRYRYRLGVLTLPQDKLDDPQLSKICRLYQLWENGTLQERYNHRAQFIKLEDIPPVDVDKVIEAYPLLSIDFDGTIRQHADHAVMYVNAVYAANEGSN